MQVDKYGSTDAVDFPADETGVILAAMELAGKNGDLEALKWCARRIAWLYETSAACSVDTYDSTVHLFNTAWRGLSAADPPPDSIAAIVDPDKTESVSAGEAGEALDTLKAFFEENLARGKIPEALKSLESVRDAVAAAGSEG